MEQRRVHRKSQTNRDQYCDALQHLDLDTGTEAHVTNVTNVPRYLLVKAGAAGRPGAGRVISHRLSHIPPRERGAVITVSHYVR